MKSSDFFGKLTSKYIWLNLAAMAAVVVLLVVGVKFGIDMYTHHGEAIPVPDIKHKSFADAKQMLAHAGLLIEVTDTGYVRTLPADCILEQSPLPGDFVKSGHVIYVIVNSANTPTITMPDIVDNSSMREAMAKLRAMGFKVGNGSRSETDTTIDYVEPSYNNKQEDVEGEGDVDEFDVVSPAELPQRGDK